MTKEIKILLTALIGMFGAVQIPLLAIFGLQPIRNLLWDLSYWLPPAWVGPFVIVVAAVGLLILLGIPAALLWLIWKR